MYMSLDRPIFFIAKKEIKQIPFLGWYMSVAGMIFLDRSNHENAMRSMRNAGNEIKKGKILFLFLKVQDQRQIKLVNLKEVAS